MGVTSIEWTDQSINPIRYRNGHFCQKVSPGCANCYSSTMQKRFGNPEFGGESSKVPLVLTDGVTNGEMIWFDEKKLDQVLLRKKPTKYFWADMTDLFGAWVPDAWIDRCFATMALTPQHTHQVLTKRPERMLAYTKTLGRHSSTDRVSLVAQAIDGERGFEWHLGPGGWHLPNVWLGVSVEDQARANERIPILLETPAAVRFLSVEPLLGPVDLDRWLVHGQCDSCKSNCFTFMGDCCGCGNHASTLLSWVILGGESGRKARPCNVAWVRSIVNECRAARVAVFVKQLGAHPIGRYLERITMISENPIPGDANIEHSLCRWKLVDKKGGEPWEWPEDLRIREFPARKAEKIGGTGGR